MVESHSVTESGLKLVCWVGAAALVAALVAIPQPVDPWEMPSLVLDRAAWSDAVRFDQALAADAPDSQEADTLRSLFLEHGHAEASPPYTRAEYDRRQAAIHRATQALLAQHGPAAFEALRAQAVEDFLDVFYDEVASAAEDRSEDALGLLGGFIEIAERYGIVYRGVVVAPELTVRALYKARWNAVHRRPPIDGFAEIELQAYWGWLALHGWGHPLDKREDALVAFRAAGGRGAEEAAALFDVLEGRSDRAARSLQTLYARRGELRLRNLALGALHAALAQGGGS